jgi:DNA-binding Lrp family transcriptional regulator
MKNHLLPTAYVLLNSDQWSDESNINEVKQILAEEDIAYEVQGVYGVYDIVLKLSSNDAEKLRAIITNKVRKISKVQSTLTMMVIEEQENL